MIIQRARQLALRSPARVVFADALDIRVLKAAATTSSSRAGKADFDRQPLCPAPVRPQPPPADGRYADRRPAQQPAMREAFARRFARAGEKTPPDAEEKLNDPLMFAAAMVSAGRHVCIAGNLSSTANVLRAGLRIIGLQPGCKTLSSIFF